MMFTNNFTHWTISFNLNFIYSTKLRQVDCKWIGKCVRVWKSTHTHTATHDSRHRELNGKEGMNKKIKLCSTIDVLKVIWYQIFSICITPNETLCIIFKWHSNNQNDFSFLCFDIVRWYGCTYEFMCCHLFYFFFSFFFG